MTSISVPILQLGVEGKPRIDATSLTFDIKHYDNTFR